MLEKAWRVINSCQTQAHAHAAMRYLQLLAISHPELDVYPLRRELTILFDMAHA